MLGYPVDPQIEDKLNQKIKEITERSDEIIKIAHSLNDLRNHSDSFACGIAIGRLYNSFFYQCHRILERDPTDEEFMEFLGLLGSKQKEILNALGLR